MKHVALIIACLMACANASHAQTPEQLIDAMVFVAKGEEDGMPVERSTLIKKTFKNGRYEYVSRGFEGILGTYAKSSKPCVFELGTIFGDKDIEPELYDLNKWTKFRLERFFEDSTGHFGQAVLEGGDSYCRNGNCTYYHSMVRSSFLSMSAKVTS
jgi:hypothetical protein